MTEKTISEVITPSDEILDDNGNITTDDLLHDVELYNLYDDPDAAENDADKIFTITYPTAELVRVIDTTLQKLNGGIAKGNHLIPGDYGSGKSHMGLVLHHIFEHPERAEAWFNQRDVDEETTLGELRQTLYFDVQEWLEEERQLHRNMSIGDLGVILRGRCLYHFSKHYPDIYHEREQVSVEKALETADEVITQVLESVVDLLPSIDVVTRAYVGYLNRVNEGVGSEMFDDLRKHLMPHNLNVSDLEDEQLAEGPRTEKQPVGPDQRVGHIEDKLKRNGDLLAIDKVHYLYHLFTTDQDVAEYLRRWKDDLISSMTRWTKSRVMVPTHK